MNTTTIQSLEKLIKENACSSIELTSGILQIVFSTKRLVIQSSWRLVEGSQIVVASASAPEQYSAVIKLLTGLKVDNIFVEEPFNDLTVYFNNKVSLKTFADSETYEHWNFFSGPQDMIIAGPGQLWSSFVPPVAS